MKVFFFFFESIVQDLINMNDYEYSGNEFNNIKYYTKDAGHNHKGAANRWPGAPDKKQ